MLLPLIFDEHVPPDRVYVITLEDLERIYAELSTPRVHEHLEHPARLGVCIDCGSHREDR